MTRGAPDLSDTMRMNPADLPREELAPGSHALPAPVASIQAPPSGMSPSTRTMLGIAPQSLGAGYPSPIVTTQPGGTPKTSAASLSGAPGPGGLPGNGLIPMPPAPSQSTLLGVARPGIAPLRPGVQKTPFDDDGYEPAEELGATYHNRRAAPVPVERIEVMARDPGRRRLDRAMRIHGPLAGIPAKKGSRRGLYVIIAAVTLALFAVGFALLWPSSPPLIVQVRAADGGAEVLDVKCPSCPDGTVVSFEGGAASPATMAEKKATLALTTPLAVGDTPLRIKVDRPGNGRDETVGVTARIAYRIRPDLTMLEADSPAIQIVVEAMQGSKVSLDGEEVPLRDGRAVRTIEVAKELEGQSAKSDTLSRKVAFVVVPPDGSEEKGMVAVNATVLPLVIDAPGPSIVTDQSTFVLAGKTLPGATIAAAGRPIDVGADGSFARTMNVSSVGATQIEVRAKMPGKAPRYAKIDVERVSSLEAAAAAFATRKPATYSELAADPAASKGKPVAMEGVVARRQAAVLRDLSRAACQRMSQRQAVPGRGRSRLSRLVQARRQAARVRNRRGRGDRRHEERALRRRRVRARRWAMRSARA